MRLMCMHMINDLLYKYYIKDDKIELDENNMSYRIIKVNLEGLTYIAYDGSIQSKVQKSFGKKHDRKDNCERAEKSICNRANIMIMLDYNVMPLKTIPIGTELKVHYKW